MLEEVTFAVFHFFLLGSFLRSICFCAAKSDQHFLLALEV